MERSPSAYLSTCVSGLQEPAAEILRQDLPDARIIRMLDGLLTYETGGDPLRLACFNNTFALLAESPSGGGTPVEGTIRSLLARGRLPGSLRLPRGRARTFRVIASDENRLVRVDEHLLRALEERIAGSTGLRPHRARPDVEYWVYRRREGWTFFLLRLTRPTAEDKALRPGTLRPELCHILNRLSAPTAEDIYLDPFCGSGALPIERAQRPYRLLFAEDRDPERVAEARRRAEGLRGRMRRIFIREGDALTLPERFEPGFVTRIVTDPPWGFYERLEMPHEPFYARMLAAFDRVLAPGGRVVLLTAQKGALEAALVASRLPLAVDCRYDILVSGQKAAVFCLDHTPLSAQTTEE